MPNIRLAEKTDIPGIVCVLKNAQSDWNEKIVLDCFSEGYCNYVFLTEATISGFLCIKKNSDFVELLQICVDPAYQRQHIATRLLHYAFDTVKTPVYLEVRASNHQAILLYEKTGFKKTRLRKKYYRDGEDAIVMDKSCKETR